MNNRKPGRIDIFLTAFKSHIDHSGIPIPVADLPEDWEAPSPRPQRIDEKMFGQGQSSVV